MGYHDRIQPPVLLGLNAKERKAYSITEALRGMMLLGEGKAVPPCLALDVHRSLERLLGRSSPGLLIPVLDLHWQRSTMQTSQPNLGGAAVGQNLSSDWISALRNRLVVAQCGSKILTDLTGNVDIPRQSGTATVFWVSEGGTIPESNLTLDMISLRPKDVGAIVPVTRRLLMQSSLDIEALIREDLLSCVAEAIDDACINGSGLNQPLGLLNHSDITEIPIGANGGALDWNHIVQMETEIAADNADTGTCHYLTNARVRGKLKTTPKVTGQNVFLWQDELNALSNEMIGTVNGYVALTSNIIKNDRNKGSGTSLSSVIFGDFSQLMIAQWGIIEVLPNPYGAGYPSGSNQMRVMASIDVGVRRPESFCRVTDVATV